MGGNDSMIRTIFQEIYQMKKLLKASTAIVGVALIASSAHANLEISGTGILGISLGSGEGSSDTMQFDQVGYYIGFSGSKKTDSGLTLSGGAFLDDSKGFNQEIDGIPATWDKTNFAISGDFGKVEVSNKGDASNLSGYSGYVAPGAGGLDGYGQLVPTGYYKTNMEIPRGLTRINYYSPNINGFSAGFSMMESGGDSEYNAKTEASAASFSAEISNDAIAVDDTVVLAAGTAVWQTAVADYDAAKAAAAKNAESGHQSAIAIGVKYVSPFGLTFGYGNTSYARSYTVKGYQASSVSRATAFTDNKDAIETAFAAATDPAEINGEYSSGWTGTRLNIGYSIGPVSFGYTSTTKEDDVAKIAGVEQKDARETEGQKADQDNVNTTIGLSYNYGAGTVGYNSQTEDYQGIKDDTKAETATVTVIGVVHTITPGVQAYLNQISGEADYDKSKEGFESASELVIGLNVSF